MRLSCDGPGKVPAELAADILVTTTPIRLGQPASVRTMVPRASVHLARLLEADGYPPA